MPSESIFVPADDGYTLTGRVECVLGLFPQVDFKYRPGLPSVRLQYTDAPSPAAKEKVGADIIERHVKEVRAGEGDPVRLTAEQAKRLHPDIFQGMLYAVLGFTGPRLEDAEKNSGGESASG
jgi:hypothetical protein